jgi:hypothetical protein
VDHNGHTDGGSHEKGAVDQDEGWLARGPEPGEKTGGFHVEDRGDDLKNGSDRDLLERGGGDEGDNRRSIVEVKRFHLERTAAVRGVLVSAPARVGRGVREKMDRRRPAAAVDDEPRVRGKEGDKECKRYEELSTHRV